MNALKEMRAVIMQKYINEITIDGFCGGGGWSTGFEFAIVEPVTIGINHDEDAIKMHKRNHPKTKHYNDNIFEVDPREACQGRPVGWAHFSPDCTHFSVAKGGKPVKKSIRGLAWVVVKWAGTVKPRIISMENVKEFLKWCPLIAKRDKETGRVLKLDGTVAEPKEIVPLENQQLIPDIRRVGETFNKFIKAMESLGYKYDYKILKACDYGAPTSRERLFIIFRNDGEPICFPEKTHADPKSKGFEESGLLPWRTAAECINWNEDITSIFERKKPLVEATLKRIARGIKKFVIDNPEPFIMNYKINNEPENIKQPLSTITSANKHYAVAPILTKYHGETYSEESRGYTLDKPMKTVDTSNRYGLVSTFISKNYGGGYTGAGSSMEEPIHTITAVDHNSFASAFISKYYRGDGVNGDDVTEPLHTITAKDRCGLITDSFISRQFGTLTGHSMDEPLGTTTGYNKSSLVQVFLEKYGIENNIEINGEKYKIVDICMRMLKPRELYDAQGFPHDYEIETDCYGNRYPISKQVARCGNSVPPQFATAIVRANWAEKCIDYDINSMEEFNKEIA